MSIEQDDLFQTALLWVKTGRDRQGQPVVTNTPVEIPCRWLWQRSETVDVDGSVIALDAMVVVDREVTVGSQMWDGTLSDWLGTGSTGNDDEVMRVATFKKTPDIDAIEFRYKVGLKRFRDQPNR
jgi:hypothetical protein